MVTTYSYDAWGNLTSTTYSDGTPSVTTAYDALGRRTSVTDAAGTTTYAYDDFGDLATETWGGLGNRVLTRHRDAYGRDAGYSVNGLRRTTLGYDSATGRLATMNEGGSFAWRYLDGSHLKSRLTYPNGITTDYTYEPNRDLLTGVRNSRGETVYSEYLYANDALGRRTAKNDEQYGYNGRSELVSAATNGTNDYAYAYDDIGNRLSSLELGTNNLYTANSLNQYTMVGRVAPRPPEDDFAPQYDEDGNQTLVRTATGIWSVEYNAENRPVRWTRGNTVVTMDFDSMGRRTFYREMEGNRQITFTRFFYDGYLMIQQLFSNSPYNIYKEFIWDPTEPVATKPLCFRQNGQAATFLTHDGNKNVTDVIRVAPYNDLVGHYDYAPFGAVRSQTGNRAASNPYRFSSEFADDALGLVYYNYRHYEPTMGRWLSRDPMDAGLRYVFVENDPFAYFDLLGLQKGDYLEGIPDVAHENGIPSFQFDAKKLNEKSPLIENNLSKHRHDNQREPDCDSLASNPGMTFAAPKMERRNRKTETFEYPLFKQRFHISYNVKKAFTVGVNVSTGILQAGGKRRVERNDHVNIIGTIMVVQRVVVKSYEWRCVCANELSARYTSSLTPWEKYYEEPTYDLIGKWTAAKMSVTSMDGKESWSWSGGVSGVSLEYGEE